MDELDHVRRAMARAEAELALSMRQPTVATRIAAIQRRFDAAAGADRDALVVAVSTRLAIACPADGPAIRY